MKHPDSGALNFNLVWGKHQTLYMFWFAPTLIATTTGVCKILENYTRSFLNVIWLKKLKTEEILEIRPAVIELP